MRHPNAVHQIEARPDWSWTGCNSFVVMKECGLRIALTSNQHFEQAAFIALRRK